MTETFLQRLMRPWRLSHDKDQPVQDERRVVIIEKEPIGSSGTMISGGIFDEEYLNDLIGEEAACVYDRMRRMDARITMILKAVKNPIKGCPWEVQKAKDDDSEKAEFHREFIDHVFLHDMDKPWKRQLHEILSMADFGHSVFENTHKVVLNHQKFGNYIGIRSMALRAAKSISRWNLNPDTGKLESVEQIVQGDLGSSKNQQITIPAKFLSVFTLDQEGDNYEGISLLRAAYGAWFRKNMNLKLMQIGIEKHAVPPPVVNVPSDKNNSPELQNLKDALQRFTSHESNYLTIPQGWDFQFVNSNFNPETIIKAVDFENTEITTAVLANFLNLGQSSRSSGAYALSFDLSDFFLAALECIVDLITDEFNDKLIPDIMKLNFGIQPSYPRLACVGLRDRAGKEFAEILNLLKGSTILTVDDELEKHVRNRYKLPPKSDTPREDPTAPKPPAPDKDDDSEGDPDPDDLTAELSSVRLAESPKTQINRGSIEFQEIMERHLTEMGVKLSEDVIKSFDTLSEANQMNAIKGQSVKGLADYKAELIEAMAKLSNDALAQAQREVPGVKVSLSEKDKLGSRRKKALTAQADVIVETQGSDVEKAVFFQFISSVNSSADSSKILEDDMKERAKEFAEGPGVKTGATIASAQVVNETRNLFFFDDDVIEQVPTMTFTNPAPVSPICKNLNGKVFRSDDPSATRFFPPLHHNCKSFLVPNLVGTRSAKKPVTGLKPDSASLEKFITLDGNGDV